jgi:hypothetical protein
MTTSVFQKWFVISPAVVLSLVVAATAPAQTPAQSKRVRVGVYDSRAIAVAYANSREFQNSMKPVQVDYAQAKLANNQKHMEELQRRMEQAQRLLDQQAYSIASIADIMAVVKGSLPSVAKEAGVEIIVSKWDLNYQSLNVEVEDVTDKLVALFHTTEQGWKWAKEIQQKPPVPIDQINAKAVEP